MPNGGDGVLAYIAQQLQRLEDSVKGGFADVNGHLSQLPQLYVPRHEIDQRFSVLADDVVGLAQRLDAAEQARKDAEAARVTGRRWALGFAGVVATVVIGLLGLILANIH